jgi:hypothetical protein
MMNDSQKVNTLPTLEDLHRLSHHEPIVHRALMHYQLGDVTLEQALIGMVLVLSDALDRRTVELQEHLLRCGAVVARQAHNLEVAGSNPATATNAHNVKTACEQERACEDGATKAVARAHR